MYEDLDDGASDQALYLLHLYSYFEEDVGVVLTFICTGYWYIGAHGKVALSIVG